MNFLKLVFCLFCMVALFSCEKNECDSCPEGTVCIKGVCEVSEPCAGVVCAPDQICVNGDCITSAPSCTAISIMGDITTSTTWTATNIYTLVGKVVVKDGVTLTIAPGTIIKGSEGIGVNASALIVERGGKLIADGTAEKPIIFTTVLDNITCGQRTGTNLQQFDFGKWGGVIVLGKATVSTANGDTQGLIEGLPGNSTFGTYGGTVDGDNSGVLRYVSIRHGGANVGDGNEINGLTLGGVGSGTVVENIEIVGNLDDGVELFGGTVNVKNVIIGFQGDDAIDVDQNYSGTVDNVYIIHGGDDTDEAFEMDGPEGTANTGLFTIKNGTAVAIDNAKAYAGDFKAKSQGTMDNIVWRGYSANRGIRVRATVNDACVDQADSWAYLVSDKLTFRNSTSVGTMTAAEFVNAYINADATKPADAAKIACFEQNKAVFEAVTDAQFGKNGNRIINGNAQGADITKFLGWSWLAINNKIQ